MSRRNIENQGDPYVLVIEFSKFDNLNGVWNFHPNVINLETTCVGFVIIEKDYVSLWDFRKAFEF